MLKVLRHISQRRLTLITQTFVFLNVHVLEEHALSSPGITSASGSHQQRCSHLPKSNKKSFSHLATLKHNLAPKKLQGCPSLTLHHSGCQRSWRPIRCWKLSLDLPGLRRKDKWCYQTECLLMTCRETKCGSFTRSHMCISIVIFPNEAHLEPVCECLGTDFFFFFFFFFLKFIFYFLFFLVFFFVLFLDY